MPPRTPARWAGTLALALTCCALGTAQAQGSKPITLIVPYTPGGTTDILARTVARHLSEGLGRPIVVDNRPGGGTILGAQMAARAPADGSTLLMATSTTLAINPSLYKTLPYKPADFTPVGLVAAVPLVVVVNPTVKATTLAELVALAKGQPGTLSFGSAGNGSPQHLAAEMFKADAGVSMVHVPYKGTSAALTDLLAGQIPVMFADLAPVLPHIRAGRLRALAVTSAARLPSLPDVPTVRESKVPGTAAYEAVAWQSIVAPPGTPAEIARAYGAQLVKVLSMPEVKDRLLGEGAEVRTSTPEQLAGYVRSETTRWARVVKASGASVD